MPHEPLVYTEPLTPREIEVLTALSNGMSKAEISVVLIIAERTVRTHLHTIFDKLNVGSRLEAVLTAQEMGLVTSPLSLSPVAVALLALIRAHPEAFAEVMKAGLLPEDREI